MHTYMFSFGSKQPLEVDIMITSIFHKGKLRLREASQLPKEHPEWGPKSQSLTPKSGVFPRVASPLGVCQHRLRTRRWLSRLRGRQKHCPTGRSGWRRAQAGVQSSGRCSWECGHLRAGDAAFRTSPRPPWGPADQFLLLGINWFQSGIF